MDELKLTADAVLRRTRRIASADFPDGMTAEDDRRFMDQPTT